MVRTTSFATCPLLPNTQHRGPAAAPSLGSFGSNKGQLRQSGTAWPHGTPQVSDSATTVREQNNDGKGGGRHGRSTLSFAVAS